MSKSLLLITEESSDAESLQQMLDAADGEHFDVKWAGRLSDGVDHVRNGQIDAILLDTFIAESNGIEIFDRLYRLAPYIPMLAFCSQENEELARQAIHHGAKGYLVKHHLDSVKLPQVLLAIIERATMEEALFIEQERSAVTLNFVACVPAAVPTVPTRPATVVNPVEDGLEISTVFGAVLAFDHPLVVALLKKSPGSVTVHMKSGAPPAACTIGEDSDTLIPDSGNDTPVGTPAATFSPDTVPLASMR